MLMLAVFLNLFSSQFSLAQDFRLESNPGIVEPLVSWTKSSIHVCWRDGIDTDPAYVKNDFTAAQKKAVQDIIQQEYTINRVGIEYVGWENCRDLPVGGYDFEIIQDNEFAPSNPIVKYYRDASAEGMAFIGEGGGCYRVTETDPFSQTSKVTTGYYKRNDKKDKKVYLLFYPWNDAYENSYSSLDRLQNTALHEFGHVAGMRHEHINPEAMNDPNCQYMGRNFTVTEKIYDTSKIVGAYDPNSIMNYCWLATIEAKGRLMSNLPNISDPSLYEKIERVEVIKKTIYVGKKPNVKKKIVTVNNPVTEYRFRVGLSQQDVIALQDLYLKNADNHLGNE
jgi:hypothetical protein